MYISITNILIIITLSILISTLITSYNNLTLTSITPLHSITHISLTQSPIISYPSQSSFTFLLTEFTLLFHFIISTSITLFTLFLFIYY